MKHSSTVQQLANRWVDQMVRERRDLKKVVGRPFRVTAKLLYLDLLLRKESKQE